MKKFKKVLIWLAGTLAVLLVILVSALMWAIYNPEKAYRIAEKYFLPKDLKVTWSNLDLNTRSRGGLAFYIDWKIEDLHVLKESPKMDFPVDRIHLKVLVQPLARQAHVDLIETLASKTLSFKPNPQEEKKEEPGSNPFQKLQNIVSLIETSYYRVPLEEININLNRFELLSDDSPMMAVGTRLKKSTGSDPLNFDLDLDRAGEKPIHVAVDGTLTIPKLKSDEPFLASKMKFTGFDVDAEQNISMIYRSDTAILKSEGEVTYHKEKMKISTKPRLDLHLDAEKAHLNLFADIVGLPGPVSKIDGLTLEMTTKLGQTGLLSEDPSQYTLKVPVSLSFVKASVRRELQKSCQCKLPLTVLGESTGEVWLANLQSENQEKLPIADTKVSIESMANKLFDLDLKATVKVDRENDEFLISPVLDSRMMIHSLNGMHPFLQSFGIVIPAPFDVLDGKVEFIARGPVDRDEKGSHFPARLNTQLSSKKQAINLNTEATVSLHPSFKKVHVAALARILDLQIELPPLNPIGGNPRVAADKRILKEPPKPKPAKSDFEVTFDFQVETANPGSIRLLSEFFKPYLPLTLNFRIANGNENAGLLKTEPFDVVYLRRRVTVEKMQVNLNELEDKVIPVDGRLKIQQTIYTIYIDIKGLAEEPTITMWSDPYLPESEIISVLLYDRTSEQLQSGDAETSANVQAAMADKAIGLFGLWAFASTPIRSFSYNPVTKVYTATVELAGGVTAGIGTTWESTAQLELRKRVTRQWMLTARWNAANQDDEQNTELVLQWEKRY